MVANIMIIIYGTEPHNIRRLVRAILIKLIPTLETTLGRYGASDVDIRVCLSYLIYFIMPFLAICSIAFASHFEMKLVHLIRYLPGKVFDIIGYVFGSILYELKCSITSVKISLAATEFNAWVSFFEYR